MSFLDPKKPTKKSAHGQDDSGELDVFEAAQYFSGSIEKTASCVPSETPYKTTREERVEWMGGRKSIDIPMKKTTVLACQPHNKLEKHSKEKKFKQPISPGGRLASFLNSLFSQTSSKKKKSKSSFQSMKDEEESPGGRRKRRSSISHFESLNDTHSKPFYFSSGSGFRTLPPYPHTPTKVTFHLKNSDVLSEKRKANGSSTIVSLDEKLKTNSLVREMINKSLINTELIDEKERVSGVLERERCWGHVLASKENKGLRRDVEGVDDGGVSDSSSDLFELQNYDLGVYSSGLPVYETTHVESIKRGAPIAG